VARPVEEVRIAEGDVARAGRDLLAHVGEHGLHRHHEEPAAVDWRDRAVAAQMFAPAARFHVRGELAPAVLLDVRVLLQRRQCGA
jgi:hypothetical protein